MTKKIFDQNNSGKKLADAEIQDASSDVFGITSGKQLSNWLKKVRPEMIFDDLASAVGSTIPKGALFQIGKGINFSSLYRNHSTNDVDFATTNSTDFTCLIGCESQQVRKEVWKPMTVYAVADEVVALSPSGVTKGNPRIYKAKTARPDTVVAFNVAELAEWNDIGGAPLNDHGGVLQFLNLTQYSVDALNTKAFKPTLFETLDGKTNSCIINANTSFNKKVWLDGVEKTTPVSVSAKSFIVYRDYEDVDSVSGNTRIFTINKDSNGKTLGWDLLSQGSPSTQTADESLGLLGASKSWNDLMADGYVDFVAQYELPTFKTNAYYSSSFTANALIHGKKISLEEVFINTAQYSIELGGNGAGNTLNLNTASVKLLNNNSGHRNFKLFGRKPQKEVVDPNLVPVLDVRADEIFTPNITKASGAVRITFAEKPNDILVYMDSQGAQSDGSVISFADLKANSPLQKTITAHANRSSATGDSSEIAHIDYDITYVDDTHIDIAIAKSGYTEQGNVFKDRTYKISKLIARYKSNKTVTTKIKVTDAVVPAGYGIKVVEGVFNGTKAREDITLTIPAGKKLLKEPELILLNPAATVHMIGANISGLAWRWQQYMTSANVLVIETKGVEVINSNYRMILTFVNI